MNSDKLLKIQACLDGELTAAEEREVRAWIAQDAEAGALYRELEATSALLRGNELAVRVPDSREFYWSQIERQLPKDEAASRSPAALSPARWLRLFAPVAGAALLAAVAVVSLKQPEKPASSHYVQEIESAVEEASAITFHSEKAGMTVVWIQSQEN